MGLIAPDFKVGQRVRCYFDDGSIAGDGEIVSLSHSESGLISVCVDSDDCDFMTWVDHYNVDILA